MPLRCRRLARAGHNLHCSFSLSLSLSLFLSLSLSLFLFCHLAANLRLFEYLEHAGEPTKLRTRGDLCVHATYACASVLVYFIACEWIFIRGDSRLAFVLVVSFSSSPPPRRSFVRVEVRTVPLEIGNVLSDKNERGNERINDKQDRVNRQSARCNCILRLCPTSGSVSQSRLLAT